MSRYEELCSFMQEVDDSLPALFKKPLPFTPSYVVAGGALRDTLLGQEVSDIDVVVASPSSWKCKWPDVAEYGPTGGFRSVTTPLQVRGKPVQLVFRNGNISTRSMVEYHSLPISNVFWKDGTLSIHKSFFRDFYDKKHTVNRSRWGGVADSIDEQLLDKYVEKIRKKYPWPTR